MNPVLKDGIQRYCIAVLLTAAATWLRVGIDDLVGDRVPFGTYMLSVLLTAWLAGTGPAMLALLLGIIAAFYHVVPLENVMHLQRIADMLALAIYTVVGVVAISLFDRSNRQHEMTRGQLQRIESLSTELQLADRRKDEFLALLSHEMRNPLAPIRSGVSLLRRDDLDEARRQAILETMSRQLAQLVHIVDDLLDVSRFMHDRIELDFQLVDLREVVRDAVEQAQHAMDDRRHELQVVVPSHAVTVRGDRIRLVQIVTNLLTNAAKYTPQEGTIHVLLSDVDACATLQVVDNGIGITPEMLPHVFELFARSRAAIRRDQVGLGLGLPIAKKFAEMHDGRLEVSSNGPGCGSRFSLVLPLLTADEIRSLRGETNAAGHKAAVTPDMNMADAEPRLRVLVVDDNRDAAELLATLLSLDNYDACTAKDGPDALRRVEEFDPDVVLLDLGLPGMDGYEVAKRLRAEDTFRELLIIAVTGWGSEADILKSQAAGIDHHLVKPVDPQQLTRVIRDAIHPVA